MESSKDHSSGLGPTHPSTTVERQREGTEKRTDPWGEQQTKLVIESSLNLRTNLVVQRSKDVSRNPCPYTTSKTRLLRLTLKVESRLEVCTRNVSVDTSKSPVPGLFESNLDRQGWSKTPFPLLSSVLWGSNVGSLRLRTPVSTTSSGSSGSSPSWSPLKFHQKENPFYLWIRWPRGEGPVRWGKKGLSVWRIDVGLLTTKRPRGCLFVTPRRWFLNPRPRLTTKTNSHTGTGRSRGREEGDK